MAIKVSNHLQTMTGTVEEAKSSYIIRDFETESFENRKEVFKIADEMNKAYGQTRVDFRFLKINTIIYVR